MIMYHRLAGPSQSPKNGNADAADGRRWPQIRKISAKICQICAICVLLNRFDMTLHRVAQSLAIVLGVGLIGAPCLFFETPYSSAWDGRVSYYVSPSGSDRNSGTAPTKPFKTIQKAVDLAQPGDVINLAPGVYLQDVISKRDGALDAPITIKGPPGAVLKGGGSDRIFEINHDNLTLEGFAIDGLWGSPRSIHGYREKLLYVAGKDAHNGVAGLRVLHMSFRNAGGECLRLRYFAQHNEVAYSSFLGCGVHDFKFHAGKRNGEAIYIGTASEQRDNGKNPTGDVDRSNNNWIHHNTFNTQGNECVDIKEGSSGNIVEHNSCTGQQDPNSGGFDARGNNNIFRYNESYGNAGAGIRLGGDTSKDGLDNAVYNNNIHDNRRGGIKLRRKRQAQICGNLMWGNADGNIVGDQDVAFDPKAPCDG